MNLNPTQLQAARSIRVVVFTDAVPGRNGVGSYYQDLIEQLSPHVDCAELIHPLCNRTGGYLYPTAPLPGDSTQRIALPRPLKMRNALKRIQPNVIVIPTPGPFGAAGLVVSRRLRVPLITGFHTHYEALADIYWGPIAGNLAQRFLEASNRLLFRHSFDVFANSPAMCELAKKYGARTTTLMGTSVHSDFINTAIHPKNEQDESVQSVLFAGRLAEEKNLPALFDAARANPDIRFTIAGDGPLRNQVDSIAVELHNVNAPGWVPRDKLISLIDDHDVLMLPSHVESFGTIALEGMARGRIVVVSGSCGIVEWPELNNAIVCIGQTETASNTLSRIKAMPLKARQNLTANARKAALSSCNWNTEFWLKQLLAAKFQYDNDSDTAPRVRNSAISTTKEISVSHQ